MCEKMIAPEVKVRTRTCRRCATLIVRQIGVWPLLLIVVAAALASARYIHPTYKFESPLGGVDYDDERQQQQQQHQPLLLQRSHHQPYRPHHNQAEARRISRRQDFDGDDADDEGNDHNAAASYQNQDDGVGAGSSKDGYEDTEPDGPYEETPVEKDGQADLERFFDDHLGASDRDGMDKENLPSNLVTLLSEPPAVQGASAAKLTVVVPMVSVTNPSVVRPEAHRIKRSLEDAAAARAASASNAPEPLATAAVQETSSFIRLPNEKMIVTHQVTARNRPPALVRSPLKLLPGQLADMNAAAASAYDDGDDDVDDDDDVHYQKSARNRNHRERSPSARQPLLLVPYRTQQTRATALTAPTESGDNDEVQSRGGQGAAAQRALLASSGRLQPAARADSLAARGSEVITTEDDDEDRVYVTNSTDRPFRIDALGGYDPEEDFMDAAKELEVLASDQQRGKPQVNGRNNRQAAPRRVTATKTSDQTRANAQSQLKPRKRAQADDQDDHEFVWAASKATGTSQSPEDSVDISFRNPETDTLYGDASESDEVVFGPEEPYQTDLEAEIRQQELDRLQSVAAAGGQAVPVATGAPAAESRREPSSRSNSNVAVDNGERARSSDDNDQETTEDDIDVESETDPDYKNEPKVEQTEATSTRTRSRPEDKKQIDKSKQADDKEDEGSWVNDGVDEMDIPSQTHQNSVLEKAAQRDEAARKAAAAEASQEQPEAQSEQAPDEGEEGQRMPNADYMKNDTVEDDSGYAKAA